MSINICRELACLSLWALLCNTAQAAELDIRVHPNNAEVRQNIANHIGELGERDERQLLRYSRTAQQQAESALQALGYYQSQIEPEVYAGQPPLLILNVQLGEPVRLRHVQLRIEGQAAALAEFQGLGNNLKPGTPLHHGHYEEAKQQILNLASRYGFFDGHFTQQRLLVDPQAGFADIELVFDSRQRYQLGAVHFEGDRPVAESLLQRLVPFKANSPYDAEQIAQLNQALQSSGYFSAVRVDADPAKASASHQVPVTVQLTARKPRSFGLGLGFSTDVGARLRFDGSRYWSNPQGHRYGAEAELSAPRQNIGLWYEIPRDPPLTNKLRYAGGYQFEEIADTDSLSRLLTFGPEWHRQFDDGWQRVLSIKWQREEYRLGDDSGLSSLFMPGIAYNYLHSDDQVDPSQGYRLEFKLAAAKEGFLSDSDLLHTEVMLKGLTTLWQRHRFLGRLQLGSNLTGDYQNVPPSQRFFAGGDQSVRGYDYQKLSPTNSDDEYVGGRYLFAASAEYQYSIADKWRIAAFIDQGNAFNSLTRPDIQTSVGVGLRWVSPVGPIRVDLAQPLDGGDGFRLHFSMGPEL